MTYTLTTNDLEQLADLLAEKVAARMPKHICEFSPEDRMTLAAFAKGTRAVRSTAGLTAVGAITIALLGWIGWAVIIWIGRVVAAGQ